MEGLGGQPGPDSALQWERSVVWPKFSCGGGAWSGANPAVCGGRDSGRAPIQPHRGKQAWPGPDLAVLGEGT